MSKIVTASILYFGAKLVIEGGLSVGELAFNILAGRVNTPYRLADFISFEHFFGCFVSWRW